MKNLRSLLVFLFCFLLFNGCKKDSGAEQSDTISEQPLEIEADQLASNDSAKLKIFVSTNGSNSNSGLEWNKPVKTLKRVHDILNALMPLSDVEVHIYPGTYKQQNVKWTFTNGKKIIFTPVNFSKERPIFDGEGKFYTWFWLEKSDGRNSNLYFRYIKVRNYSIAVWLKGDSFLRFGGWNGNNHFYGMFFENIGNKYTDPDIKWSPGAVLMINSRNNVITNSHFLNLENRDPAKYELLHAVYTSTYSSNNIISWNRIENVCGDPINIRDESNWNNIKYNKFIKTGKYGYYSCWYCRPEDYDCDKQECPSWGNQFRNNECYGSYYGYPIPFFNLWGRNNKCQTLPAPRLRTSGNKHLPKP